MVRLVFRPYTQVGRPICTSGPLRASTRVSSGFALPGHSSPSFGSHRARSRSTCPTERDKTGRRCAPPGGRSRLSRPPGPASAFTAPRGVARDSLRLARALDSLVRVSRRVGWDPTSTLRSGPQPLPRKGEAYRSRPGRTARKKTRHPAKSESPKANTRHREIAGPL